VVVLSPYNHGVEVSIDGGAATSIGAGGYKRFTLPQGPHKVEIKAEGKEEKTTKEVTLKSKSFKVVPVSDDQCFVQMDIALSHYSPEGSTKKLPIPKVSERFDKREPFEVFSGVYFKEAELPADVDIRKAMYLFEEVPCKELSRTDEDLVKN